jgi:protein phosphatase
VLHPLPDGAILDGRYVVRGLIQHAQNLNLYRAQARGLQRCPNCGALAAQDARVCARCQTALTGAAPLLAYVVADAHDREALVRDPTVIERGLNHPNLMPLVDEFSYTPYGDTRYYTAAEARQGVPLAQLTLPQPPDQVVEWGLQLTEALRYLHEQGVLSPGATAGNVLIKDNEAVLANLQQARPASPDPVERGREFADDVTGLAGLLYETLTGHYAAAAGQGPLLPDSAPALETAFARALRPGPDSPPLTAEGWHDLLLQAREALHTPAPSLRIRSGRISDVGRHRPLNEDSLAAIECQVVQESISAGLGVYAVADGMGGHAGGEVASALAIATVTDGLVSRFIAPQFSPNSAEPSSEQITGWLTDAVQTANGRINLERNQRGTDMGTTLVVALLTAHKLYIANVGDSRAYLWTPGGDETPAALRQVSVDHSLVQRLVTMGQITPEEAKYHPYRNMIYKSLGEKSQVEIDLFVEPVVPGLRLLLCSDGLSGMVPDPQIAEILAGETDPQVACARLIAAANEAGGTDNITAITVYVDATGDARNMDAQAAI